MGKIIISDIEVDTEDIDLLVRHKPLAELDFLCWLDQEILAVMSDDDPLRTYWVHREETHRIATELAGWCFENGIPYIDLPRKERDRTQGLYALEKCRELEVRLDGIEKYLTQKPRTSKYD